MGFACDSEIAVNASNRIQNFQYCSVYDENQRDFKNIFIGMTYTDIDISALIINGFDQIACTYYNLYDS